MDFSKVFQDNIKLRPHQIDAKAKILDAWSKYDSVMLQMPTGTGKTYLFTSLINDLLYNYTKLHKEINILVLPIERNYWIRFQQPYHDLAYLMALYKENANNIFGREFKWAALCRFLPRKI